MTGGMGVGVGGRRRQKIRRIWRYRVPVGSLDPASVLNTEIVS